MNVTFAPQVSTLSSAGVALQAAIAVVEKRRALSRMNRRVAAEYDATLHDAVRFFDRVSTGATMFRNTAEFFRMNLGVDVDDLFNLAGGRRDHAKVAAVGALAMLNKSVEDHLARLARLNAKLDKLQEMQYAEDRQAQDA